MQNHENVNLNIRQTINKVHSILNERKKKDLQFVCHDLVINAYTVYASLLLSVQNL